MISRESYIKSPIEIKRELLQLLDKKSSLIVFDIGACEAEDSIRYSNLFPKSNVYAFEPRTDNCAKAKELIKQYNKTNIILENIALSNQNGTAEFYLSEGIPETWTNTEAWDFGNKSSSLLAPTDEIKKQTNWLNFKNKIEVQTLRLDEYISRKNISGIDFIHIDVQGAELMVFEGAGSFFNKIKLIWMEVEAVELYKNQPLKNDIEKFMTEHNFVNILDKVDDVSGDQLYANLDYYSKEKLSKIKHTNKQNFLSRIKSIFK